MEYRLLHHGSDDKLSSFKGATFFFIDNPEIASSYGRYVYECTVRLNNVLSLGTIEDDIKVGRSGLGISGSSEKFKNLIRELLHGLSDDDINESISYYNRYGLSVSPARIFNDSWDLVVRNLIRLGYDGMEFRDESSFGSTHGIYLALLVIDSSKVEINTVIEYDDTYGDEVKRYNIFESFIEKLLGIGETDSVLLENILLGYREIFEAIESKIIAYHGTNSRFSRFDSTKTNDSLFWFSTNRDSIIKGESGASGTKYIMKCILSLSKSAGWAEYDKYTIDELIQMGVMIPLNWMMFM